MNIVAVTGEGEFYSSGNDLSEFMSHTNIEEALVSSRRILKALIYAFFTFSKILICVVNGPCIGIAATTAVLSDVIYASDTVNNVILSLTYLPISYHYVHLYFIYFSGLFLHTVFKIRIMC